MNLEDPTERKRLARWAVGVAAACIFLYLGLRYVSVIAMAIGWLFDLLLPLLIGALIAVALNIPMGLIEERLPRDASSDIWVKARRPIAIAIALLIVFGVIVLVVALILPELINVIGVVVNSLSRYIEDLTMVANDIDWSLVPFGDALSRIDIDWASIEQGIKALAAQMSSKAGSAVGGAVDIVADVSIGLVFAVYALNSKERLCAQFARLIRVWLPERVGNRAIHVVAVCYNTFRLFVVGQVIEAVILGVLCALGMLVLRLPYAAMIGALVCVTAMIPYIGGLVGGIVGVFMIFSVDPFKAFVFLVFLVILQQIEGNIIYPRVVGGRISLPSVWVFAAVVLGGKLAGPIGMLFAVPAAASGYSLLREATEDKELQRIKLS